MRFLRLMAWLLSVGVFPAQSQMMTQSLKVLVLDALDGTPQSGVQVHYFCTGKPNSVPPGSALTDKKGLADVPYSCSNGEDIELWTSAPKGKEQCGDLPPFTFNEITSQGVVSKPDAGGGIWCPTKVSQNLKPVPGQVTVFVKKPTWWQSHVAG